MVHNIETGHFERSLSGVTAVAAAITSAEIYLEHYRASFGNKLDVEPDHRHAAGRRRRVDGDLQPAVGQDVAAAHRGRLHRQWPARACTCTRAAWPAARRLASWPPTTCPWGRRSLAPGLMTHRRGDGPAGRAAAPGGVVRCPTSPMPTTCPTCGPAGSRRPRAGCPGSDAGTTPQMIGRYPDYDVFDAADTGTRRPRKVVEERMPRSRDAARSSLPRRSRRCAPSATWRWPRTRSRGCR